MEIHYNPTITGGFVYHVLNAPEVNNIIKDFDLSEKEEHDLVKQIIIVAFRDYKADIDKKINLVKRSAKG